MAIGEVGPGEGGCLPSSCAVFPSVEDPEHLLCPITFALFRDPVVVVASGNTYERSAILAHWERRGWVHDPLSNEELDRDEIVTNWGKRREVQAHLATRGPGFVPEGWDCCEMLLPPASEEPEGGIPTPVRSPRHRWHHHLQGPFPDDEEAEMDWLARRGLAAIFPSFIMFQNWMVMGGWLCWWRSGGGSLRSTKGVVGVSHCLWTLSMSLLLVSKVPELRWEYLMASLTGMVHGLLLRAGCPRPGA